MAFFNFKPTWGFIAGASLVNYSVYLYGLPAPAKIESKTHTDDKNSEGSSSSLYHPNLSKV